MKIFVGCDLGGTNIKAGLVNIEDGHVLISDSAPTLSRQGPESVMERISNLITDLIAQSGVNKDEIGGLGISAPGALIWRPTPLSSCRTCMVSGAVSRWASGSNPIPG